MNKSVFINGPLSMLSLEVLLIEEISDIRVIYAHPGKSLINKYGHIMLHIERPIKEDLVVSYRGHVTDFKISNIKGIAGGYKIRPFVFLLKKSLIEYTTNEGRHLESINLNLNKHEKEIILNKVIHDYWHYNKSYNFFFKNCSSEVHRLLKPLKLFNDNQRLFYRPDQFYKFLKDKLTTDGLSSMVYCNMEKRQESSTSIHKELYDIKSKIQNLRLRYLSNNFNAKKSKIHKKYIVESVLEQYELPRNQWVERGVVNEEMFKHEIDRINYVNDWLDKNVDQYIKTRLIKDKYTQLMDKLKNDLI